MLQESLTHFYGEIKKFDLSDDGSMLVSGIASTESVDAQGEIITADAMRKALPAYLQKGSVREMHQPIAAGVPVAAHVDDNGNTHFTARIVDLSTIQKIKLGVLKGFSIGGRSLAKIGNKITEIVLKEISLVDIPCNPESYFTILKIDNKPMKKCKHCDEEMSKDHMCDGMKSEKEKADKIDALSASVEKLTKSFAMIQKFIGGKEDEEKPTIESLLQKVEALEKNAPARSAAAASLLVKMDDGTESVMSGTDIVKALSTATKALADASAKSSESEKGNIIEKLMIEGRVIYKEDGTGAKLEELQKMDLPLLKFAARNAQAIPLVAKAIYSGTGKGPDEKDFTKVDRAGKKVALEGTELIVKAWENYDLAKMMARGTTAGL